MRVFLDLEGTVIKDWYNPTLINTVAVAEELKSLGVSSVGIFSFAVSHSKDMLVFDREMRPRLEEALGVRVDMLMVFNVKHMMSFTKQLHKLHFDFDSDFISTRGKEGAFEDMCRVEFPGETVVLIDDVVRNLTLTDHDTNSTIRFVPVRLCGG